MSVIILKIVEFLQGFSFFFFFFLSSFSAFCDFENGFVALHGGEYSTHQNSKMEGYIVSHASGCSSKLQLVLSCFVAWIAVASFLFDNDLWEKDEETVTHII